MNTTNFSEEENIQIRVFETFSRFGLNEKEARVYLTLLELNPTNITSLSRGTKIPRATVHRAVERLLEKGLASQSVKGESRVIVAEPPEMMESILIAQEAELRGKLNEVNSTRKNLDKFYLDIKNLTAIDQRPQLQFKYYEGRKPLTNVYKAISRANTIHTFVNLNKVTDIFPENVELFRNALNQNESMVMKELIEDTSATRDTIRNLHERYFYRFIPLGTSFSSVDILIYDATIALINLDNLSAIVINSPTIVETLLSIHNVMWNLLQDS